MFAASFRSRLIAWYISLAGVVALALVALAAVVLAQVFTGTARQSLSLAARQIGSAIGTRTLSASELQTEQARFARRYAEGGIIVRARSFPSASQMLRRPPGPPPRGGPGYFPDRNAISPIAGLLELNIRPERLRVKNGEFFLFIDPARINLLVSRFAIIAAAFVAIVLFVAWRIAEIVAVHALAPLLRTTRALSRFAAGDFTPESVDTNDRSELGQLARAYNGAVAQITYAFDERSKAEAEMRQFVADAGHQLRTPLTVVMGHLSGIASREGQPCDPGAVNRMLEESRRMKALIDDLIVLAKLEHPEAERAAALEMNALVSRVVASFAGLAENRITFREAPEPLFVLGSESELFSAVAALIDNALKYAPKGRVSVRLGANERNLEIDIEDEGPGLGESDRARIFDRFYRGETSHGIIGTGLGLAIVRRSAERAEGRVTVENRDEGGLRCRITLPTYPQMA